MPVLRAKATQLHSIYARTGRFRHFQRILSWPRGKDLKKRPGRPSARRRFNASNECLDAQTRKSPEGTLSAKSYVPRQRSPRTEVREFQLIHSLHRGKDFKRAQNCPLPGAACQGNEAPQRPRTEVRDFQRVHSLHRGQQIIALKRSRCLTCPGDS